MRVIREEKKTQVVQKCVKGKVKKKDSALPTFISCSSFKKAGSYPFSNSERGVLSSILASKARCASDP